MSDEEGTERVSPTEVAARLKPAADALQEFARTFRDHPFSPEARASLAKIDSLRDELAEIPALGLRRASSTQRRVDGFVILACLFGLSWWVWSHWHSLYGTLVPLGFVVRWALPLPAPASLLVLDNDAAAPHATSA